MKDYTRKCEDCGVLFNAPSDQRMANSWACKKCAALRPRQVRYQKISSKWRRLKERVAAVVEPKRVEVPEEFLRPQPKWWRPNNGVVMPPKDRARRKIFKVIGRR